MAETMPPADDTARQAHRRRVGAYAKLLANYASDDALIEAGEAAELLFVRGLAFCATSDADGYITHAQVIRYVGAGMKDAAKRAERLADCGVWERVPGGYNVRSWLKIHESSSEKGRRRKADRERKKNVRADSDAESVRIPDGIREEGSAESLSLIHDRAEHDTARHDVGSLERERPETLRAADATEPTCSKHPLGDQGDKCGGCAKVREWRDRNEQRAKDEADHARTLALIEEQRLAARDAVPMPDELRKQLAKRKAAAS